MSGERNIVDQRDFRLYAPMPEGQQARLKENWEREFCFIQNPGEDHFHQLMYGEIYIQRGHEKFCLNCARRHGLLTTQRVNWQKGSRMV